MCRKVRTSVARQGFGGQKFSFSHTHTHPQSSIFFGCCEKDNHDDDEGSISLSRVILVFCRTICLFVRSGATLHRSDSVLSMPLSAQHPTRTASSFIIIIQQARCARATSAVWEGTPVIPISAAPRGTSFPVRWPEAGCYCPRLKPSAYSQVLREKAGRQDLDRRSMKYRREY